MFQLEKEMIPVLKRDLSRIFGAVHAAEEFVSGNGRPDLVFARFTSETSSRGALDYETLHLLVRHLNKEGRVYHVDEVLGIDLQNRKRVHGILDVLSNYGFVEYQDDTHFIVRRKYQPVADEFVSIEAKLSDWKSGVSQAIRYKSFSNSTYLAISEEYLDRVDRQTLRASGVGLISVSRENASLILKARTSKPKSMVSNYYLTERLVDTVNSSRASAIV
ncbi:MAG: hypothetical protein JWL87_108 [Candidatus Adlerbacteria bacterium]|nr:hypothetical protein [Candidatus Adlerbacteria bacterium]